MTCTEWCPHCESETELEYKNEYQPCEHCNEMIAPCAQNTHGKFGTCVCQKQQID